MDIVELINYVIKGLLLDERNKQKFSNLRMIKNPDDLEKWYFDTPEEETSMLFGVAICLYKGMYDDAIQLIVNENKQKKCKKRKKQRTQSLNR